MTAPPPQRLPHVALDLASRNRKVLKFERLLDLAVCRLPPRLLDAVGSITASALRRCAKPWPLNGCESCLRGGLAWCR